MPTSSLQLPPINLHFSGADTAMNDTPPELSTSPSSLAVDDEQLTQTIHYIHEGKLIAFEIVNKRMSLTRLDSNVEEVDPIPGNIFERILKATLFPCIPLRIRRVKPKPLSTIDAS